ncbi:tRNA (adenosine(37)-N6)-threonylcarbamoyltransferase complex dimerization subunit type 1 TsaB [Antarcticibacterium arcticum]|uniref:tRNA (Adenosine(37)-N6)-threonylcarbamoyltransferase complex dimerization subunit type 1 TsaB n=1 Tax=Antarcticibacterium arcticum TaxID=2585771 RepID=A0A5B8YLG9_9FLAO|nr:tRNA (adenosine(37)-N6)-threonylcarbamoyltransferase complex dimerization subunit type 1 TsaB [Antarcticibacterium arcticum]QED38068.1 tRNA (adenosine(37)-N6)-threonylcarbamoyltransferase complex dimerization subunit type 1 TsaB [Antarcticibacterium arcticum]
MASILCIETASTNCSVALSVNGKLLALKEDNNLGYSHSEKLHHYVSEILQENGLKPADLDAIAISKGPGSYTGLRIGVSAAKGLCFSLDIPLISVATLTALAHKVEEEGIVVPMLDARRMEVYSAVFNAAKEQLEETSAKILEPHSYDELLNAGKVYFIGSGVEKFQAICTHPNAVFVQDQLPSAKEMVPLAEAKFQQKEFENVAYFEPFYLKDFMVG